MIWRHLDRQELGFANSWSSMLREMDDGQGRVFPDLRGARTLVIASDYGGLHRGAAFETYAFVLASLDGAAGWEQKRVYIREKLIRDSRRMSYKGLNDRIRRNALASFLDAANDLTGVLVCFGVDRRLPFSLCADEDADRSGNPMAPVSLFPRKSFRRLIRIGVFASLFLAGLTAPMQDVLWFSDEDDFVEDDRRVRASTEVLGTVMSHFLPHTLGRLKFGSTRCDDGSRAIEDLAALPDLAAGAVADFLAASLRLSPLSKMLQSAPPDLLVKARYMVSWLADQDCELKKFICVLSGGDTPNTIKTQWLTMATAPSLIAVPRSSPMWYRASVFGEPGGT